MTEEQKKYYRDPRWQRYRLNRLERAEWKCEECGDAESQLHVHHTFYRRGRKPWEYPFETTKVLCDRCHEEAHDIRDVPVAAHPMVESMRPTRDSTPIEIEEWVFFEKGEWITVKRPRY